MPSPNYSPPTQAEMRTIIGRTLRDPSGVVFSSEMLNDIINEGLADLSGFRPIEAEEVFTYDPGDDAPDPAITLTPDLLNYIWQVEVRNDNNVAEVGQTASVPYEQHGESSIRNGWDYYGGNILLGRVWWNRIFQWYLWAQAPLVIALSGYRDRVFPTTDDEVLDLQDSTDYLCLTKASRMLGFQLLTNDRALYQQWLAATNNTDVSPTQLQGMLNIAQSDYDRQRRRSSLLRRSPFVGPQYP